MMKLVFAAVLLIGMAAAAFAYDSLPITVPGAELTLQTGNNKVYIRSLRLNGEDNIISPLSQLPLPKGYKTDGGEMPFVWKLADVSGDRRVRTFVFEDETAGAIYKLFAAGSEDKGAPFQFSGELTGTKKLTAAMGTSFNVRLKSRTAPLAWTFDKEGGFALGWKLYNGTFTPGSGLKQKRLENGSEVSAATRTDQNWNAGGDIPMMYLDYGTNGLYIAYEWSNCLIKAVRDNNRLTLTAALADGNMITKLEPGRAVIAPPVYLGIYSGDIDDGSNAFKRWFIRCKAPKNLMANANEPLTQQDMQIGYNVAQYGIQQIKIDYGWWSDEKIGEPWRTHEGLLEMHNSSYLRVLEDHGCKSFEEYVQKAKNAGVGLTVYILTKDTKMDREGVPTSVGKYGHPEWFSNINITGSANSADFGNEECVKFFSRYMLDFFKKTGITTWRSDFEPITRESDKENRHFAKGNDVQYWCTVGFGELVDYLRDNYPDFRYESCSSGGSMKDLFTATKASVINTEDSADYMSNHMAFYDSSYCIHPMQLQMPCNALTYTKGSANYTGTADYLYGLRCIMTGGVMLSNWGGTTEEDKSYWPYHIKNLYNLKLKPLIRNGDLYHILPRPDGVHWDGIEYYDPDSEKGCIMLWKPTGEEGSSKNIKVRGIKPGNTYSLTFEDRKEQNKIVKGKDLLENGLTVIINEEVGSEIIWINKK